MFNKGCRGICAYFVVLNLSAAMVAILVALRVVMLSQFITQAQHTDCAVTTEQ